MIKYFAMLNTDIDIPTPMITERKQVALYETEIEASNAAYETGLGFNYGFKVYGWPDGGKEKK